MKVSELIKLLKKKGCFLMEHGASHDIWYSSTTGRKFTVPRHRSKELPTKTAETILRAAGIK